MPETPIRYGGPHHLALASSDVQRTLTGAR
jgi:hypothetical protein